MVTIADTLLPLFTVLVATRSSSVVMLSSYPARKQIVFELSSCRQAPCPLPKSDHQSHNCHSQSTRAITVTVTPPEPYSHSHTTTAILPLSEHQSHGCHSQFTRDTDRVIPSQSYCHRIIAILPYSYHQSETVIVMLPQS